MAMPSVQDPSNANPFADLQASEPPSPPPTPDATPPATVNPFADLQSAATPPTPTKASNIGSGVTSALKNAPDGQAYIDAVHQKAQQLGVNPDTLFRMAKGESDFDPTNQNGAGYMGLYQIHRSDLQRFGINPSAYLKMSRPEQLSVFTDKYLPSVGFKPGDGDDQLMMTLPFGARSIRQMPPNHVVWGVGTKAWEQNPGWRTSGNGPITVGSALAYYQRQFGGKSSGLSPSATPTPPPIDASNPFADLQTGAGTVQPSANPFADLQGQQGSVSGGITSAINTGLTPAENAAMETANIGVQFAEGVANWRPQFAGRESYPGTFTGISSDIANAVSQPTPAAPQFQHGQKIVNPLGDKYQIPVVTAGERVRAISQVQQKQQDEFNQLRHGAGLVDPNPELHQYQGPGFEMLGQAAGALGKLFDEPINALRNNLGLPEQHFGEGIGTALGSYADPNAALGMITQVETDPVGALHGVKTQIESIWNDKDENGKPITDFDRANGLVLLGTLALGGLEAIHKIPGALEALKPKLAEAIMAARSGGWTPAMDPILKVALDNGIDKNALALGLGPDGPRIVGEATGQPLNWAVQEPGIADRVAGPNLMAKVSAEHPTFAENPGTGAPTFRPIENSLGESPTNPPIESPAPTVEPPVSTVDTPQPQTTTGARNSITETEDGVVDRQPYVTPEQHQQAGKAAVESGEIDPIQLAEKVASNPHSLSGEEVGALTEGRRQLINAKSKVGIALDAAIKADAPNIADLQARYNDLADKLRTNTEALVRGGREQSSAFLSRKMGTTLQDGDYFESVPPQKLLAEVTTEAERQKGAALDPVREAYYEDLVQKYNQAQADLQSVKESNAKMWAEREVQRQASTVKRGAKVADIQARRAQIVNRINAIARESMSRANSIFTVAGDAAKYSAEVIKYVGTLVEEGITRLPDVVAKVREILPKGATDHEIHQLIGGVDLGEGEPSTPTETQAQIKEIKTQAGLIYRINEAMGGNEPGARTKPVESSVVQGLRKSLADVKALQDARNAKPTDPAVALRAKVESLLETLQDGPDPMKRPRNVVPDTLEIIKLRVQANALGKFIDDKYGDARSAPEAQQRKLVQIQNKIAADRAQLEGQYRNIKRGKVVDDANVEAAKAQMKQLGQDLVVTDQIHDLEEQLRTKQYTEPPKKPDRVETELTKKRDALKSQIKVAMKSEQPSTVGEKLTGWARMNALSSPSTFGNLGAAVAGHVVISPFEEALGPVIRQTVGRLGGLAEKAGTELKFSPKAEFDAASQFVNGQTWKDVGAKLIGNMGSIERQAIADGLAKPHPQTKNWVLRLEQGAHGSIKTFTERNAFARQWTKSLEEANAKGKDINSPEVRTDAFMEAYGASRRGLLLNDTKATMALDKIMNAFGDTGKGLFHVLAPITKIPVTLAGRSLEFSFGTPYAFVRHMYEWSRGTMTPESAAAISRAYKRGGVGLGLAIWAANSSTFDVDDQGHLMINGVTMPTAVSHIPWVQPLMMGVYYRKSKSGLVGSIASASVKTLSDIGSHTPFVDVPRDIVHAGGEFFDSPDTKEKKVYDFFGNFLRGLLVPQGLQQYAAYQDSNTPRKPDAEGPGRMLQQVQKGIPANTFGLPGRPDLPTGGR